MTRWQESHDPLCPSSRAKDWQIWWAVRWCQCDVIAMVRADERKKCPRVEIVAALGEPTTCKVWRDGNLVFDGIDRASTYRSVAIFDLDEGPLELVIFGEASEDD